MIKVLSKIKLLDVFIYILAVTCSAAMIISYRFADDKAAQILLWPHAKAIELFYNTNLTYMHGAGYNAPGAAFTIGRDCMGVNFISTMFCMLVCAFVHKFRGIIKFAWFGLSLLISAVIGVFVSILRIIGSVPFISLEKFATLHTWAGIALYFIALLAAYFITKKILGGRDCEKNP